MTPLQQQALDHQSALIELKKAYDLDLSGKNRQSMTIATVKAQGRRDGIKTSVAIVESFNRHTGCKNDLFGIIDVLAITPTQTRGIQVCGSDWQPHIRKLQEEGLTASLRWLECPSRTLELWGWRKIAKLNSEGQKTRQTIWVPRVQLITPAFLAGLEDPRMVGL